MTVSEFIELLKTMPQDFEVYARDHVPWVPDAVALYKVAKLNRRDEDRAIEIMVDDSTPALY